MARPKDADAAKTQTAILDAAEGIFAEHGFSGARMVGIAEGAGVTHSLLHYYFESKEKLYAAVIDRLFGRHLSLVQRLIADATGDGAPIREVIVQSFDLFWEHPNQVRIMLWEMASGDDRVERIAQPFFETMLSALPTLNNESPAAQCATHDTRDVYATLLGALVVYFFRDPTLKMLYKQNRFTEADRTRRRAHIGSLVDLFF